MSRTGRIWSVENGRFRTDETAQPALHDQHAERQQAKSKPSFDVQSTGCAGVRPVMAIEEFKGHPSPILKEEEVASDERKWRDIGSGIFARTFVNVSHIPFTTRGGPVASDVHRRIVRSLTTGKVIDDCLTDDVGDAKLHRLLPGSDNVRVEHVMKKALSMYQRKGAEVVELFSQPRIAQEAGLRRYSGTKISPGWSLDLTMRDPEMDKPWGLSKREIQTKCVKWWLRENLSCLSDHHHARRFRSCKALTVSRGTQRWSRKSLQKRARTLHFVSKCTSSSGIMGDSSCTNIRAPRHRGAGRKC